MSSKIAKKAIPGQNQYQEGISRAIPDIEERDDTKPVTHKAMSSHSLITGKYSVIEAEQLLKESEQDSHYAPEVSALSMPSLSVPSLWLSQPTPNPTPSPETPQKEVTQYLDGALVQFEYLPNNGSLVATGNNFNANDDLTI